MTDAERLDWLENQHTLHRSVEIQYVVDGYHVELCWDDDPFALYKADNLRGAIDLAMKDYPENAHNFTHPGRRQK